MKPRILVEFKNIFIEVFLKTEIIKIKKLLERDQIFPVDWYILLKRFLLHES